MSTDCLFCKILRKEIPAKIVLENEHCVAFRDIDPKAPTHVLVIPREHIPTLNDVRDPEILGRMVLTAVDVAKQEGLAERGYRTVMNTNKDALQSVFHIHLHLLGGRKMGWPPG